MTLTPTIVAPDHSGAPKLEPALFTQAATLIAKTAEDGGFHGPSIDEFFPDVLFSVLGVPVTRIHLIQFIATIGLVLFLWLGTRRMRVVPGRFQSIAEMGLDFVRVNIAEDLLGKKDGQRFLPILTTMFFMILFFNITGIIPFMNLAGTSIIAVPLMLAVISYVTFIYAGIKKSPKNFFKNALFPSGVPPFLYIIVTPLEFLSTFIIRPVTLTLRLLMNMIVGHLMLVLFFSATQFFLITLGGWWSALAAGSLAFGLAFTLFEILVAFLQAYVFTILTAVYIQLAVAEEH
ncbi:F0F1 ATP synthase subunit A [Microbacterium laevaniformans]|uniref:ATP synthase subunit a n=1 Tax=Microbacterium laevaniformans TaxID=36807 RepID=A0A4S2DEQ9_9MICO|nr:MULTISPECIES: F0F1 ATP synthase subunit A [Microbacterium]MDC7803229.1 F0F1 ATP synthase subunit A [Sphingomonas sp. BLCC-B65]AXA97427.1 ATP synthase F0 subunit A [Microbacterium sp. PM5]MBM7751894.1 F-type H+-transporting ATPase subunit a [Microbacterium laevaniformans]TGY39174.1 ATP synthase F0 subunit A [Microbacterium laevaniformans]GLJ65200.1 ATP synthase subunit a [Microbacterium laevaniformans]